MGGDVLSTTIVTGGQHNEALWRNDFEGAYLWLFDDWASAVGEIASLPLVISPNPATDPLRIGMDLQPGDRILLADALGKACAVERMNQAGTLDVTHLAPGIYFLHVVTEKAAYLGKFIKP